MRLSEEKMREEVYIGGLVSNEYLKHHGIKGQKWGTKHGPPYPLDDNVSDRIKKMKSVGQKKVDPHDTATMAKYKTTNRINRHLRASYNSVLGQKLAVRLNKGYREDRKEIKSEYKAAKKSLDKKAENYKEQKKELKSAYKESKTLAATRAADAIYGKQSHELNYKVQSESIGKAYVKSMLLGGYGSLAYDNSRVNDAASRVTSAYISSLTSTTVQNNSNRSARKYNYVHDERYRRRLEERDRRRSNRRAAFDGSYANSFLYSQTGVSKEDRQRVKDYVKSQKQLKKTKR